MIDQFFTGIVVLLGSIIGWCGKKLFSPIMDKLGKHLLGFFVVLFNRKGVAMSAYSKLEKLVQNNHTNNGYKKFIMKKTYLRDQQINSFLLSRGSFMRRAIKDVWIEESYIDSYNESNVFFAGMEIFLKELKKKDLQKIFQKHKDNNQAALWSFLELVKERRPRLLSTEAVNYYMKSSQSGKINMKIIKSKKHRFLKRAVFL